MKKCFLLQAVFALTSLGFVSCGGSSGITKPPGGFTERVFVSQSAAAPTAASGLVVVNGYDDTLVKKVISAGTSPGMMITDPSRATLLAFDSATNSVQVVSTARESSTGSIQLPGPTTSLAEPNSTTGFAAVPNAILNGSAPGGVVEMNLASGGTIGTFSVPGAQTVISNAGGSQLLVFSNDASLVNSVTIVSPFLLNSGSPTSVAVTGFDHPVYGIYSPDGSTAYILNCGPQCGGIQASVQLLNVQTSPPSLTGPAIPVDAATIGYLSGSTLYVAGTSPSTANNACTGESTAATVCGRLDTVNLASLTVTGSAVITNGYHDRIDLSLGGQLFIGSYNCTTVGNVNNPQGEVRGCLSIFNTTNGSVVIPPDNCDVTGLQSFSSRYVEYVAEGGYLRVYDTQTDTLLENTQYIPTGTIVVTGIVTDVKAVDFF